MGGPRSHLSGIAPFLRPRDGGRPLAPRDRQGSTSVAPSRDSHSPTPPPPPPMFSPGDGGRALACRPARGRSPSRPSQGGYGGRGGVCHAGWCAWAGACRGGGGRTPFTPFRDCPHSYARATEVDPWGGEIDRGQPLSRLPGVSTPSPDVSPGRPSSRLQRRLHPVSALGIGVLIDSALSWLVFFCFFRIFKLHYIARTTGKGGADAQK